MEKSKPSSIDQAFSERLEGLFRKEPELRGEIERALNTFSLSLEALPGETEASAIAWDQVFEAVDKVLRGHGTSMHQILAPPDTDQERERSKQWSALYEELTEILDVNVPPQKGPDAGFLIVDDDYRDYYHHIYLTDVATVTHALVDDIQVALRTRFPQWGVIVSVQEPGMTALKALTVRTDKVDEHWDASAAADQFGPRFSW